MTASATARLAWGIWVVCALLVAASVAFLVVRGGPEPGGGLFHYEDAAVGAIYPALGALILTHRPRNPVGWCLVVAGVSGTLGVFSAEYANYTVVVNPGALPAAWAVAWVGSWSWLPFLFMVPLLLLLFPDGRPPTPRWRPLVWCVAGSAAITVTLAAVATAAEPLEVLLSPDTPDNALVEAALVAVVVSLASGTAAALVGAVLRWRRAAGVERARLKWFAASATAGVMIMVVGGLYSADVGTYTNPVGFVVVVSGIPVAILRHQLYDIDRILSRTVSYGVVTALLAGLYGAGVVALGRLLAPVTEGSQLAVAGSTLAVAAAFGPVRRRVQTIVDRRFNRARYDAGVAVAGFRDRLRDAIELDQLSAELLGTVDATVQPARAWLWLAPARRQEFPSTSGLAATAQP